MRLAVCCALVLLAACGTTRPKGTCAPSTCGGCCDADDKCQAGNSTSACGSGGAACSACDDLSACRGECVTAFAERLVVNWTLGGSPCGPQHGVTGVEADLYDELGTPVMTTSQGCAVAPVVFSRPPLGKMRVLLTARLPSGERRYTGTVTLVVAGPETSVSVDMSWLPLDHGPVTFSIDGGLPAFRDAGQEQIAALFDAVRVSYSGRGEVFTAPLSAFPVVAEASLTGGSIWFDAWSRDRKVHAHGEGFLFGEKQGEPNAVSARLQFWSGSLSARWRFVQSDGGELDCADAGVAAVAFEPTGFVPASVPCSGATVPGSQGVGWDFVSVLDGVGSFTVRGLRSDGTSWEMPSGAPRIWVRGGQFPTFPDEAQTIELRHPAY